MKKYAAFILGVLFTPLSFAWDGSVSGKISGVDVTGGTNYGFRVYLSGSPAMCGNDHKWAYINENDSNYQVYVSALLAAKAMNSNVVIYSNRKDGDENGYCKIGYIMVR